MLKSFEQFIKESEDLFVPRNLEGRVDKFFRNLQRKLDSCNGIWEGDLNLQKMEIPKWFRIPDNLEIKGDLNLSYSNISKLPKNLQCKDLDLYGCNNIKELPEGLNVENLIDLSKSPIERLPKNLQCKDLWLDSCKNIKELPEGLNMQNGINLSGSSIEKLPKNLQCKNLYLQNCKNLKELPEGLNVQYLYIKNSSLTKEYCEQMKQEGKISYQYMFRNL